MDTRVRYTQREFLKISCSISLPLSSERAVITHTCDSYITAHFLEDWDFFSTHVWSINVVEPSALPIALVGPCDNGHKIALITNCLAV